MQTLLQKQGFVSEKQKEIMDFGKGSLWDRTACRYTALLYSVKQFGRKRPNAYFDLPQNSISEGRCFQGNLLSNKILY